MLFVGKLIPLHGVETILAAAALCPEIDFHVVGSGQLDDVLDARPGNVHCEPWVDYQKLPDLYRSAGCALGIFGTSEGSPRHPEQGLSGAGNRDGPHYRRHACEP